MNRYLKLKEIKDFKITFNQLLLEESQAISHLIYNDDSKRNEEIMKYLSNENITNFINNYLFDKFWLKYRNYQIGFENIEDFIIGIRIKFKENFIGYLIAVFSISKINIDNLEDIALNINNAKIEHKDAEGNYQSTKWDDDDFQQTASYKEQNINQSGNVYNLYKSFVNKPYNFTLDFFVNSFDNLFFMSENISLRGECDDIW